MTWLVVIGAVVGWLAGVGLAWAFIAGATRHTLSPSVRLHDLGLLAVCA